MNEAKKIQSRHTELTNDGVGRCDIAHLRDAFSIPESIAITNCSLKDHDANRNIDSINAPFFASYFASGLTLPLHPFTRNVLSRIGITPSQGNGNFYKLINCFIMLGNLIQQNFEPADLFFMFTLKHDTEYGGLFFERTTNALEILSILPSNDDKWDKYPLMVSGDWEFGSEVISSLTSRVAKTKAIDLSGVCKRVNELFSSMGEPNGYKDRVKKFKAEGIMTTNFDTLMETYCTHPGSKAIRSLPEEDFTYTPIEVSIDLCGVLVQEFSKKRKLRYSDGRSISKSINKPSHKKTALSSPTVKVSAELDNSSPKQSPCERSTKNIVCITATSSQERASTATSEDNDVAITGLDLPVTTSLVHNFEHATEQPSYILERRSKTTAMLKQYSNEDLQYRATAEEKANAPSWVPSFGKDGNKVFSTESTLFYDQNDAVDFLMGMGTPRDHRYLSLKDELTKHYLAQHHIAKASMLYSSNNKFMESISKQITEMNLLLNRLSIEKDSLNCQNKELQNWKVTDDLTRNNLEHQFQAMKNKWESVKLDLANTHQNNINLENTVAAHCNKIKSLSAQLIDLESQKNEAEDKCAQALTEKIDAETRSAEAQVKLNQTEAHAAELQSKLIITETAKSKLLAHNIDLQTKLDGAPAFYQDVIDNKAENCYQKGLSDGYKKCINLYGFIEVNSEDEQNDPKNIGFIATANKEGISATKVNTQCIGKDSYTSELINNVNIGIERTLDGTSSTKIVNHIQEEAVTFTEGPQFTVISETLE